MKITLTIIFLLFITFLAVGQPPNEVKQGVKVTLRDGTTVDGKLDFIEKDKIVIFVVGPDRKLEARDYKRSDVLALSFDNQDYGNKFNAGDQGVVLSDGTVIKGHLANMDGNNFVIHRPETDKMQSIERTKVAFIQFEKPAEQSDNQHTGGGTTGKTTRVVVSATQPWTDTGIDIQQGQMVRLAADEQELITCDPPKYPTNNAHGVKTYWLDPNRPVPDAPSCSLIGKIGFNDKPFNVALHLQLQSAKQSGRLFLGINDIDFRNNRGQFTVTVEVQ